MYGLDGKTIAEKLIEEARLSGADVIYGKALSVMPLDEDFGVAVGSEFTMCSAVILAPGITREKLYPGEGEFLGRGVSYCATCDGMLYRGKTVAVVGNNKEAEDDAAFLENIGCRVIRLTENLPYEIKGGLKADTLIAGTAEYKTDCVFIIKTSISVAMLAPGVEYENGAIKVTDRMETAVPGIFAAGDCTGKPYQLSKAAGEGNIAALSACEYIDKRGE